MRISDRCPYCGGATGLADGYAGQSGPCASCGRTIRIPPRAERRAEAVRKKRSSVLIGLTTAAILLGLAVALLLPLFQAAWAARRQHECTANLKQIGLALHNYYEQWECFPPAYLADENGRPMHSWRVLILPYLGEQALYREYRFDEPWNSPHNLGVARQMPSVFRCPEDWQAGPVDTSYAMLVGPGAFCEGPTSTTFDDITDGPDHTLAVVEVSGFGIRWTQPRDLDIEGMTYTINDSAAFGPMSHHYGCAEFLFADGSVRALGDPRAWDDEITPEMLRALITRAGGDHP